MNYYFQMPNAAGVPRYRSHIGEVERDISAPMRVLQLADKAWAESGDGTVKVIKDRFGNSTVDLKEFFWVKLSSVRIN